MSVNASDIEDFEAALKGFEMPYLKRLQKFLNDEIGIRQNDAISNAIIEIHKIASSVGMKPEDLLNIKTAKPKATVSAPVKYRHPTNPELKWSGRGRRPLWIEQLLNSGKDIKDLAVHH